jgi:hypothetical protein
VIVITEIIGALKKMVLPHEVKEILRRPGPDVVIVQTREELLDLAVGGAGNETFDVSYDVPGRGMVREAYVARCKNGVVGNYDDIYMRRRDPDSMVIADDLPTDKKTYEQRFGGEFEPVRLETFEWLRGQEKLIIMPFYSGNEALGLGYASLLIAPVNAAFFALALADIQGFIPRRSVPNFFKPKATVFVAPPFRHTHFDGKQVVIHNRQFDYHEVFSYNLYPGPSAKKGIYGVLLNIGEQEKWVTLHASSVKVVTPYELTVSILHEGASGSGKSEMLEQFHREGDGRLLLGRNIITGEKFALSMNDSCDLHPITDDMAMTHPSLQDGRKRLVVADAEEGWFMRVDHITEYGTEPETEKRSIHPPKPLVFINMDAVPGATCLIWEPILDEVPSETSPNGKPCPNPRLIVPRCMINNHVDEAVEIDVRSFGLRQPPTTRDNPNYGIAGMFHVLPPALAWLWRLASPRGHANPSVTDTGGMKSEGVGSYWPFATGKMVDQANLLLTQILRTLSTRFLLIPNQYIGAYKVGFAGQWATREYIARRGGAKFNPAVLLPCRCPLLGFSPESIKIDGVVIPKMFLRTHLQPEVGGDAYDRGAVMLAEFFKAQLSKFLVPDLLPQGRRIIETCLGDGDVSDYYKLIPKL